MKTKLLVPALLLTLTTNLFAQSAIEQIEGSINNVNSLVDTLTDSIERAETPEDGIILTEYPLVKDEFIRQARAKTDAYKACLVEIKNQAVSSIQGYETEIQRLRNTLRTTESRGLERLLIEREDARENLLKGLEQQLTNRYQSCQRRLAEGLLVGIEVNEALKNRFMLGGILLVPVMGEVILINTLIENKEKNTFRYNFAAVDVFGFSQNNRAGRFRTNARETVVRTNAENLFSGCSDELACYYLLAEDWKSWFTSLRSLMVDVRLSSSVKLESLSMARSRKMNKAVENALGRASGNLRSRI